MAARGLPLLALQIIIGILNSVCVCGGDLLAHVEVPGVAVAGGRVNVSCTYDLRATGLYSLKWYHNDTEFYRYVPTETHRPVDIKPTVKFQAHEIARTETGVTLSLTSMTSEASGEYKCEVIAEHPSFRTEASGSFMTVLDEPLTPPIIAGGQDMYEGDEQVPAREVWHSGSSVVAECRLRVDSQVVRASTTLRVRARHSSYLFDYSTADHLRPTLTLLVASVLASAGLHA